MSYQPEGLALEIFQKRYARHAEETWQDGCERVANHVAAAEKGESVAKHKAEFVEVIRNNLFMPGGRIWYGSGRPKGQLLNCFVVPTEDSREGWGETVKNIIIVTGTGGGVGLNASPVRPRGAPINGSGGTATGSVSLMEIINAAGEVIKAGGGRRTALMLALDYNHPDIVEFLDKKLDLNQLKNANVSVVLSDNPEDLFKLVKSGAELPLTFHGREVGRIPAATLWNKIVTNAVKGGEPGLLNGYYANKMSNISYIKPLISTNPSMPAGTLVGTDRGIFPIEELDGKQFRVKSLDGEWADAKCFLSGEHEELVEISFGAHKITHSTKQHRWPVITEHGTIKKVFASDLKVGDHIPLNRCELTGMVGDASLTREEGFFLGFWFGDGWISERTKTGNLAAGIEVGSDKRACLEKVAAFVNRFKTKPSNIVEVDGLCTFQLTAQDLITGWVKRYGWYMDRSRLPGCLWTSNDDFVAGFVDGLLSTDGHISAEDFKSPCIILTTSKPQVAIEFDKLLSFYGVASSLHIGQYKASFPNGKDYKRVYTRCSLRISSRNAQKFATLFKLSNETKQKKLNSITARTFRCHPKDQCLIVKSVKAAPPARVWDISVDYKEHVFPSQYVYTGNCGEIFLESYGCCCLGAIVLPRIDSNRFNEELRHVVRTSVRFLDDVLTVNNYPLPQIAENCKTVRRIGLGVMGIHDLLLQEGLRYNSDAGLERVNKVMGLIKNYAYEASIDLAVEKGPFPAFEAAKFLKSGFIKTLKPSLRTAIAEKGIRNCCLLTIAPTGTTSMVSNVTSGIEPMFAPAYRRKYRDGDKLVETVVVHPLFQQFAAEGKSTKHFQGAYDLKMRDHFEMQRVCQRHIDNAVSKTINIPQNTSAEELSELYMEYLPELKGVTVYPEGSRADQPLTPMTLSEAREYLKTTGDVTVEATTKDSCKTGSCDV